MTSTAAYAALTVKSPLVPYSIKRREPGPHEVLIDILYCGVCHQQVLVRKLFMSVGPFMRCRMNEEKSYVP